MREVDIIGAGPAGLVAAINLAQAQPRTSLSNRMIYELLTNRAYEFIFQRIATRSELSRLLKNSS